MLHAARGIEIIGKPPEYGKQKRDEFVAKHYHQPSDEVDPTWDLSGAVQDVQLLFEVGYQVANGDKFPDWKAGQRIQVKTRCNAEEVIGLDGIFRSNSLLDARPRIKALLAVTLASAIAFRATADIRGVIGFGAFPVTPSTPVYGSMATMRLH